MRLWSLHPKYLDTKGLVALWREGLLAQAVLAGQTRGYRHHPQLARFIQSSAPERYIAAYLKQVCIEAVRRGYHFDETKIGTYTPLTPIPVTNGQLEYEWSHLSTKLKARSPDWLRPFQGIGQPEPHPIFFVIQGEIAPWEVVTTGPSA